MRDGAIAQWLVSRCVDSHLTLDWLKWHHYHVCMANGLPGGRSRGGTCVWRVSSRWEHTWARLWAPSAPKSILTPLKRLSASMALQCNYPVGNDISTQFLPASLSCRAATSSLRPVHRDFLDHAGLRTVVIWSLRPERWRSSGPSWWESSCYLISEPVLSLSLSQIECDVA